MRFDIDLAPVARRTALTAAAVVVVLGLGFGRPGAVFADPPVAVDDTKTVAEDAAATTIDVLANDTTTGTVTILSATNPAHGNAVVAQNGLSLTYAPDANFNGEDTFDYTLDDDEGQATATVVVTVDPVNDAPLAFDDPNVVCSHGQFGGAFPVPEDYSEPFVLFGTCGLLANDTDVDGDELTWEIVDNASHGHATFVADDFFAYQPDPDYSTLPGDVPGGDWFSDSFTYRAFDGTAYSNTATMRFWIAPINDPPTFTPGASTVTVDEDSGAYSEGWASDVSPGPDNEDYQAVSFEMMISAVPGLFSVAPAIDGAGTLTFTPAPNKSGTAHITTNAKDDGGDDDFGSGAYPAPDDDSDTVTFDIVVTAVNDAPVATNDSATLAEDSVAAMINVLVNDNDVDNGPGLALESVGLSQPQQGTAEVDGDVVTYTPAPNYNGPDSFTYTVSDGDGGQDTATVTLTITPVNDPPTAVDDGVPTPLPVATGFGPKPLAVLDNDTTSPDTGETLTIISVSQPAHGVVAITGGGSGLTYDPPGSYVGSDQFTYRIGDGHGLTDLATVHINVTPDITGPIARAPRVVLAGAVGATSLRASIAWSATDSQSGVTLYQLQQQADGGTWVTIALPRPTTTRIERTLASGHDYRFRVRAKDGIGNLGGYATSRRIGL